jgi:hypothetical protein
MGLPVPAKQGVKHQKPPGHAGEILPMPCHFFQPENFNFIQTIHTADKRIPIKAIDLGAKAIYELLQRFGEIE